MHLKQVALSYEISDGLATLCFASSSFQEGIDKKPLTLSRQTQMIYIYFKRVRDVSYSLHEKATCSVCLANNMSHKQELGEEKYFLLLALSFSRIFTL